MDSYKTLGQFEVAIQSGAYTDLYTCPVRASVDVTSPISGTPTVTVTPQSVVQNTRTLVTSIVVCNTSGATMQYYIRLLPTAVTTPGDEHRLFHNVDLATKKTDVISPGMTLEAGYVLQGAASAATGITMTVFGIEIT